METSRSENGRTYYKCADVGKWAPKNKSPGAFTKSGAFLRSLRNRALSKHLGMAVPIAPIEATIDPITDAIVAVLHMIATTV